MNVLQPAAQLAVHDIASGVKGAIRPQQTPRRLSIADLAELASRPAQATAPSSPPAASPVPPQDRSAVAPVQTASARGDARPPVRPGTFLDIRV